MGAHRYKSPDKLTEVMRHAVHQLARGASCAKTARACDVTERTLYRWRMLPEFQRAVLQMQREMFAETDAQGLVLLPSAIMTLTEIMNDPEARASDRIAASRALIHNTTQYHERLSLQRQIQDLEKVVLGTASDGLVLESAADPDPDLLMPPNEGSKEAE